MRKSLKLIVSIAVLVIITSLSTISLCASLDWVNPTTEGEAAGSVTSMSNQIIGIIQIIGTAIAVVMLIWLAIKYISAAPSEKADIKKSATIYVVGAVLLFGAVGVLQIIKGFTEDAGLDDIDGTTPTQSNQTMRI